MQHEREILAMPQSDHFCIILFSGQVATGSQHLHDLLCSFNISSIHTASSCHVDEATMTRHNSVVESWRCLVHRLCPFYFREGERRKESLRLRIREQIWDLLLHGNAQVGALECRRQQTDNCWLMGLTGMRIQSLEGTDVR